MKRRVRKYVKKYLAALVPMALAAMFALNYATVYSRSDAGPGYKSAYTLIDFIAENWFYVGAAISGAIIAVMLVHDLAVYWLKKHGHGQGPAGAAAR
jgi:hypothetical protein